MKRNIKRIRAKDNTPILLARATADLGWLNTVDPDSKVQIAVMDFPIADAIRTFTDILLTRIKPIQDTLTWEQYPPYRQLNNGLSLSYSIVHGFEPYYDPNLDKDIRRMLAVSQPIWREGKIVDAQWDCPDEEKVKDILGAWLKAWGELSWLKPIITQDSVGRQAWNDLFKALMHCRLAWRLISLETLITDVNAESGLIYQAVPSLLATLLHGKTSEIKGGQTHQKVTWRKVCDGNRIGLSVVSNPFKARYEIVKKGSTTVYEGYFAYRVDFRVQTQAGFTDSKNKLIPWVFIDVHCQRYGHRKTKPNFGRRFSALVSNPNADVNSSPLIRLQAEWDNDTKGYTWINILPDLLQTLNASTLIDAKEFLDAPARYGNLDNNIRHKGREYYLIHAEGYKYDSRANHGVMTGFTLKERSEVVSCVLDHLGGLLCPDSPLQPDDPALLPKGQHIPLMLRHHKMFSKAAVHRTRTVQALESALCRTEKQKMHIAILFHNDHFKRTAEKLLKEALRLLDGEDYPEYLTVTCHHTPDYLHAPLGVKGLTPKRSLTKQQIKDLKSAYNAKVREWYEHIENKVVWVPEAYRFTLIESLRLELEGNEYHEAQSIKGAVRQAACQHNAHSQFVQTFDLKLDPKTNKLEPPKAALSRVKNGLLEVVLRQSGALYGTPSELYRWLGIPDEIAARMDIISFCLKRTTSSTTDIRYALASRLRSDGQFEICLPSQKRWVSYIEAALELGNIFIDARKDEKDKWGKRKNSSIKLKGQQLKQFITEVLIAPHKNPTLVLIEADGWRNERTKDADDRLWAQLKNEHLSQKRDVLELNTTYSRRDSLLQNILGIVRIRSGVETPQYVTNRAIWSSNAEAWDLDYLTGFVEYREGGLLHYFSVGGLPMMQKDQRTSKYRGMYKLFPDDWARYAIKHQQAVEFVPFFVRPDFEGVEEQTLLCRVPHFLRVSPAFTMGNITRPYPIHAGYTLIDDLFCILEVD